MPAPAINGTYPHPGIPGAEVTAGAQHLVPWLQRYADGRSPLACDIETYGLGLDARRLKCVTISTAVAAAVFDPRDPVQAHWLIQVIDYAPFLVFHNAPFDVLGLTFNRLMRPQHVDKVVDTVVFARLAEPGETVPKTLEAVTDRYLGIKSDSIMSTFKTLGYTKKEGFDRLDIDSPAYLFGAAADGIVTARLAPVLRQAALDRLTTGHPYTQLQPQEPGWANEEIYRKQRFNQIMLRRTVAGLRVDLEFLEQFERDNQQARDRGEAELIQLGIRPGNGNDLTAWLIYNEVLRADHPRTRTGKPSTTAKDLEMINHPVARLFVQVKRITKIQDDYLTKVKTLATPDVHGDLRVHPVTNVLAAAHGRTSVNDPPLQQFPGAARGIILPDRQDEFASVDWAQQEPVIGLNMAGDVDALADYEQRGKKIYDFVSATAGVAYKTSKVILLAGLYGEGLRKLSADLNLDPGPWVNRTNRKTGQVERVATYAAARDLQRRIFGDLDDPNVGALPRTWRLVNDLKRQARAYKCVVTMNGRIVPIPYGTFDGERSIQAHKAPNYRISGSAADQFMDTVLAIDEAGLSSGFYMGQHDECVVSKHIMHDVQKIMETPPPGLERMAGRVPKIRTDAVVLGERWSDA